MKAVGFYRDLAIHYPDRIQPDLASSLHLLMIILREFGAWHQALKHARESLQIYRDLYRGHSAAYGWECAESYKDVLNCLCATNLRNPKSQASDLFGVLQGLAGTASIHNWPPNKFVLADPWATRKALSNREKGLTILKQIASGQPGAFRRKHGKLLARLASVCMALGQKTEALRWAEGAVAVFRQLASESDASELDFALSLCSLACRLIESGRHTEAKPLTDRAFAMIEALAARESVEISKRRIEIAFQLNELPMPLR